MSWFKTENAEDMMDWATKELIRMEVEKQNTKKYRIRTSNEAYFGPSTRIVEDASWCSTHSCTGQTEPMTLAELLNTIVEAAGIKLTVSAPVEAKLTVECPKPKKVK